MSELVINAFTMSCCGLSRSKCTCTVTSFPSPPRTVNQAFDENNFLPLPEKVCAEKVDDTVLNMDPDSTLPLPSTMATIVNANPAGAQTDFISDAVRLELQEYREKVATLERAIEESDRRQREEEQRCKLGLNQSHDDFDEDDIPPESSPTIPTANVADESIVYDGDINDMLLAPRIVWDEPND